MGIPAYHDTYSSKEAFNNGEQKPATIRVCANYSVPLVSGYTGYLPGKKSENLMGGGMGPMSREAQELFSSRERAVPDKRDRGLWYDMQQYYDRERKKIR